MSFPSARLDAGDEVLVLSHGYPAVRNAVRYVTGRAAAHITEAAIPFPRPQSAAIIAADVEPYRKFFTDAPGKTTITIQTYDPSDRLIGATAMSEAIALVTKDRSIRNFKQIKTIW